MKTRIEAIRYNINWDRGPYTQHSVNEISEKYIYIADYACHEDGVVVISGAEQEIESVKLDNSVSGLNIYYDAFGKNAFRKVCGNSEQQCECVLFPDSMLPEDWILFIETKYTLNDVEALDETKAKGLGYPCKAVNQIKQTTICFRNHGVITDDKLVTGIISFPKLPGPFNDSYWAVGDALRLKTECAMRHSIDITICNSVTIHSATELEPII